MKTLICFATALFAAAFIGSGARAFTASHTGMRAVADAAVYRVAELGAGGHRRGGLFSNWCAYNCYLVRRCYNGHCLGKYGYSHYAYDEDLPFPYRYDRDASPIDNGDAFIYPFTGEPGIRAFERIY